MDHGFKHMPHSGYDKEKHIGELETAKIIMEQDERKMLAEDIFMGGDFNIELKLDGKCDDSQGLDSLDCYGLHGLECRGGGEDVITYEV